MRVLSLLARALCALRRADVLTHDINYFGTMMVAAGDADGMVSGANNTTAATIRPGMQVRRGRRR